MSNADLVALRVRVIAPENLLISLLATASNWLAKMTGYISPRRSFSHHPLTVHAAAPMIDLIERSSRSDDVARHDPLLPANAKQWQRRELDQIGKRKLIPRTGRSATKQRTDAVRA